MRVSAITVDPSVIRSSLDVGGREELDTIQEDFDYWAHLSGGRLEVRVEISDNRFVLSWGYAALDFAKRQKHHSIRAFVAPTITPDVCEMTGVRGLVSYDDLAAEDALRTPGWKTLAFMNTPDSSSAAAAKNELQHIISRPVLINVDGRYINMRSEWPPLETWFGPWTNCLLKIHRSIAPVRSLDGVKLSHILRGLV